VERKESEKMREINRNIPRNLAPPPPPTPTPTRPSLALPRCPLVPLPLPTVLLVVRLLLVMTW
jgi:hypothetical protein